MKFFTSPKYHVDIGPHVFPTLKYQRIAERLRREIPETAPLFREPKPAADEDILRVHTPDYVRKLKTGKLSYFELQTLELPWSPALVEASWICAQGTMDAVAEALHAGASIHIGGGFHHAFADHGEGFCVLNDVAIGIRRAQADKKIEKALVVDLDVHQGNGTAAIFSADPSVFTFSMHHANNYPVIKPPGSLDINLDDGCGDDAYLEILADALGNKITKRFTADLLVYVAGADPYEHDQLGGLGITLQGFARRDAMVFNYAQRLGIPLVGVLAGGYAENFEDTVAIHYNMAAEAFRRWGI